MGTSQRRSKVTATLWYFVLGVSAGLLLGYIFMGMDPVFQFSVVNMGADDRDRGFDSSVI